MSKIAKLLSLVLAIVMVLSLAVAAVDYADIEDLEDAEVDAIEAVTKYGVMNGTGNGFDPEGLLTREQMAKVVYITVTGKENPGDIYAGFLSDIPDGAKVSDWAKNYVGYAAIKGILKGDNNGNINPKGNVTYIEAAIMLLRALGKEDTVKLADGTEIPEYTGADWDKAALADALDLDLFADVDVTNFKAAMPRKAIAVMTVNTINADIAACKVPDSTDPTKTVKNEKLAKLACHTAAAQANLVEVKAIVTGWKYDKTAKKNYFLFDGAEEIDAKRKYEIKDLSVVDELIGKEVRFLRNGKGEIVEELTVPASKSSTTDELNKFSVTVDTETENDKKELVYTKNTLSYKGADGKTVKLLDGKFDFGKSYVIRDGKYVGAFDANDVDRMNVLKNTFRVNDEVTVVVNENGSVTFYYDVVRLTKKGNDLNCGRIQNSETGVWTNEYYLSLNPSSNVTIDGDGEYNPGIDNDNPTWFFVDKDFYDEYYALEAGAVIAAQISYSYATEKFSIDFVDAIEEIDVADLSITKKGTGNDVVYTIKNGEDTLVYDYMGDGVKEPDNLNIDPYNKVSDGQLTWKWYGLTVTDASALSGMTLTTLGLDGFLPASALYATSGDKVVADAAAIYAINGGSENANAILYVYNNVILGGAQNAILEDPVYAIVKNEIEVTKNGDTNTIVSVQYLDGTEEDLVLVIEKVTEDGKTVDLYDVKGYSAIGDFIQITERLASNKRIKVDSDFDLVADRYALELAKKTAGKVYELKNVKLDDGEYFLYDSMEKGATAKTEITDATKVYCIDVDGKIEFTLDDIEVEKNKKAVTINGEWIDAGSLKVFDLSSESNKEYTDVVIVVYDIKKEFKGFPTETPAVG